MGIALKAEDVCIRYITGDFKDIGIKEYATRKLTHNYHVKEFMAVDGVSFELESGDMLGIIGSNGAGKSTLLKAISGIMEPTRGKITANGEIAALLELGSGFDGDLTVKENAYLRGAMLGYTKAFMDETYDQIIEFAELREFEERPFKQLSSGMKARLAFSIASLVNPDILILDEVLSVGDGAFQEKSSKKMQEIIHSGATTILVSHSLEQIQSLCNKILWLDHGRQVAFGETKEICERYDHFLHGLCPASMVDTEVEGSQEDSCYTCMQEQPVKSGFYFSFKTILTGLFLATVFTGMSFLATMQVLGKHVPQDDVCLYAQSMSENVTYRGASVDGQWYGPGYTVISSDGWLYDEVQDVFVVEDSQKPLHVRLPSKMNRSLTFNVGPDEGSVKIIIGKNTTIFNLSAEEDAPLGVAYELPVFSQYKNLTKSATYVAAVVFVLIFMVVLHLSRRTKAHEN